MMAYVKRTGKKEGFPSFYGNLPLAYFNNIRNVFNE